MQMIGKWEGDKKREKKERQRLINLDKEERTRPEVKEREKDRIVERGGSSSRGRKPQSCIHTTKPHHPHPDAHLQTNANDPSNIEGEEAKPPKEGRETPPLPSPNTSWTNPGR